MARSNNIQLTAESEKKLADYVFDAYNLYGASSRRGYMEWMDRQYARKWDLSSHTAKAQVAAAMGDPTKYRNIIYPIIMPQVESAVAYQTEVFCSGVPLFPVVTSPKYASAGKMLETVIDRDAQRGAWGTEFTKAFRDAYKYNFFGVSCFWETRIAPMLGAVGKEAASTKPVFEGNIVRRLDCYNTFVDPRIPLEAVATLGEYAGETRRMPLTALRCLIAGMPQKYMQNYNDALASQTDSTRYVVPKIGDSLYSKALHSDFNWLTYLNIPVALANGKQSTELGRIYDVTTVAVRICPRDFGISGVSAPGTPQLFKLVLVNWRHVISFTQLTTDHDQLPFLFGRAYEDGLDSQTPSMVENIEGMQQLATAKVNGVVAAMRRAISDRAIYNPMLIESADVNSDSPTAKIRMKPSSMLAGDASKAYYPIPYNGNTEALSLGEIESIEAMSYKCSGQNPARQGQFVKGNKTREEYNSVMDNATAGDRMTALHFESRLFTPLKMQLRYNVLRNQGADEIFSYKNKEVIQIAPGEMENAVLEFKISDGMTPTSKLANSELLTVAMQTVQAVGALQQQYDVGSIFGSLLQAGGITIDDYRYSDAQVQYNQALSAWQMAAAEAAKVGAAFNTPMPQPPQNSQEHA